MIIATATEKRAEVRKRKTSEYGKNEIFGSPRDRSYPLTKDGKPCEERVDAALRYIGKEKNRTKLKSRGISPESVEKRIRSFHKKHFGGKDMDKAFNQPVHPGKRGAHWYYDERGNIRYGTPKGKQNEERRRSRRSHGVARTDETGTPLESGSSSDVVFGKKKSLIPRGIEAYVIPEAEIWQLTINRRPDVDLVVKAWRGSHSAVAEKLLGKSIKVAHNRIIAFAKAHQIVLPHRGDFPVDGEEEENPEPESPLDVDMSNDRPNVNNGPVYSDDDDDTDEEEDHEVVSNAGRY